MRYAACILLAFFSVLTISLTAQSNSFYIGANSGINLSKFKFTEDLKELYPTSNSIVGVNGGFIMGFEIQNWTLSSGVQYVQKGGEYQTENFDDELGTAYYTAKEKLHFVSVPILLGYQKYLTDHFGMAVAIGPSLNFGLNGKIDGQTEYFGSDEIELENNKVAFGTGVNEDYKKSMVGFQISPSLFLKINDRSRVHFNITWDMGTSDAFNPRYKDANEFFTDYKGDQTIRSTMFTIGYTYHFNFEDKY